MSEETFTSYVNMERSEIQKLIVDKINLLFDKLNGKIEQQERDNTGLLFWNCKMILRNISMACNKLTSKFSSELTKEDVELYNKISKLLNEEETNWKNIDSIKVTYAKVEKEFEFLKTLIIKNKDNILIEHTISSTVDYKFKLPKIYGNLTKKSDFSFNIGNYINIMITKYSNVSKLNERAKQWLENSAKTNNQHILNYKERTYLLNNGAIEVIEMMAEKDNRIRIYKFFNINELMFIFGFSAKDYDKKFEDIINNAIIDITESGNQMKIESLTIDNISSPKIFNEQNNNSSTTTNNNQQHEDGNHKSDDLILNKNDDIKNTIKDDDNNCSGWDAITKEFDKMYPGQKDPKHYGTLISREFGGKDPLKGISIYDSGDSWHFVTYGLTELYEKTSSNLEISGYGMEFTFRLKKSVDLDEEKEIKNICAILQSIARITFENGEVFKPFEYLYSGQKEGIDVNAKSNITGFITIPDIKANVLQTPNGRVEFVELIGVTDTELKAIMNKEIIVRDLYSKLGTDITDYNRESII